MSSPENIQRNSLSLVHVYEKQQLSVAAAEENIFVGKELEPVCCRC